MGPPCRKVYGFCNETPAEKTNAVMRHAKDMLEAERRDHAGFISRLANTEFLRAARPRPGFVSPLRFWHRPLWGCNTTEVSCCNSLAHEGGSRTATVHASEDQFMLFGRWVCIGIHDTLAPGVVPASQAIPVALAVLSPNRKPHRLKGEILQ